MQSSNLACKCRNASHTPFHCHCNGLPYSCDYLVPLGHEGRVSILCINNPDIAGVAIEQAVIGGGTRVVTNAAGKCNIVCIKNSKTWYPYKELKRCCGDCEMLMYRPWLLNPQYDSEIVLPAGCYRFVAYDCDYNLIVPGAKDLAMIMNVEQC